MNAFAKLSSLAGLAAAQLNAARVLVVRVEDKRATITAPLDGDAMVMTSTHGLRVLMTGRPAAFLAKFPIVTSKGVYGLLCAAYDAPRDALDETEREHLVEFALIASSILDDALDLGATHLRLTA